LFLGLKPKESGLLPRILCRVAAQDAGELLLRSPLRPWRPGTVTTDGFCSRGMPVSTTSKEIVSLTIKSPTRMMKGGVYVTTWIAP
jgi:hypothetical protein